MWLFIQVFEENIPPGIGDSVAAVPPTVVAAGAVTGGEEKEAKPVVKKSSVGGLRGA